MAAELVEDEVAKMFGATYDYPEMKMKLSGGNDSCSAEEQRQPKRSLTKWYLTKNKDGTKPSSSKTRQPLPKSYKFPDGAYTLYGTLILPSIPQNTNTENNKLQPVILSQLKQWCIDLSYEKRGIWIQTCSAWYYLKEPCTTTPLSSSISQESIHLPLRAKLGLLSNIFDLLSERSYSYMAIHNKRTVTNIHALLSPQKDVIEQHNRPPVETLNTQPYDLDLLTDCAADFVKFHLVGVHPKLEKGCRFMESLDVLRKINQKEWKEEKFIQSAREAEKRGMRYPWGEILPHAEGKVRPNRLIEIEMENTNNRQKNGTTDSVSLRTTTNDNVEAEEGRIIDLTAIDHGEFVKNKDENKHVEKVDDADQKNQPRANNEAMRTEDNDATEIITQKRRRKLPARTNAAKSIMGSDEYNTIKLTSLSSNSTASQGKECSPDRKLFSAKGMSISIDYLSRYLEPEPSEQDKESAEYQMFSIKEDCIQSFLDDIIANFNVLNLEMMLLVVHTIVRSGTKLMKAMFRNKKENRSGGYIIFKIWLCFLIQKIEDRFQDGLVEDNGNDNMRMIEEIIVSNILKLICKFTVIKDIKQILILKNKFSVDWNEIAQETLRFGIAYEISSLIESSEMARDHLKHIQSSKDEEKSASNCIQSSRGEDNNSDNFIKNSRCEDNGTEDCIQSSRDEQKGLSQKKDDTSPNSVRIKNWVPPKNSGYAMPSCSSTFSPSNSLNHNQIAKSWIPPQIRVPQHQQANNCKDSNILKHWTPPPKNTTHSTHNSAAVSTTTPDDQLLRRKDPGNSSESQRDNNCKVGSGNTESNISYKSTWQTRNNAELQRGNNDWDGGGGNAPDKNISRSSSAGGGGWCGKRSNVNEYNRKRSGYSDRIGNLSEDGEIDDTQGKSAHHKQNILFPNDRKGGMKRSFRSIQNRDWEDSRYSKKNRRENSYSRGETNGGVNYASKSPSMGRGREKTIPAWMTRNEHVGEGDNMKQEGIKSNTNDYNSSRNKSFPKATIGLNSGVGRGRERTTPAWMTKKKENGDRSFEREMHGGNQKDNAESTDELRRVMNGVGRGKERTMPAWMTRGERNDNNERMDVQQQRNGHTSSKHRNVTENPKNVDFGKNDEWSNKNTSHVITDSSGFRPNGLTKGPKNVDFRSTDESKNTAIDQKTWHVSTDPSKGLGSNGHKRGRTASVRKTQHFQGGGFESVELQGTGRGRGRTTPAWMTQKPNNVEFRNADEQKKSNERGQLGNSYNGMSAGRGRERTTPAWMNRKPSNVDSDNTLMNKKPSNVDSDNTWKSKKPSNVESDNTWRSKKPSNVESDNTWGSKNNIESDNTWRSKKPSNVESDNIWRNKKPNNIESDNRDVRCNTLSSSRRNPRHVVNDDRSVSVTSVGRGRGRTTPAWMTEKK